MFHKRKYLFTSNSRSDRGVMASVCGSASLVSFIIVITIVLKAGGNHGGRLGAVGFVSCLFSVAGVILGGLSLTEKDRFPFFPRYGFAVSLLSLLLWGAVIYAGIAGI